MLFLLNVAVAAPCVFTGMTADSMETESLHLAYDSDETTWATGTNFALGLILEEGQWVKYVGVLVSTDKEVAFDLDIWYLPAGAEDDQELFNTNGTMPAGENRGLWPAEVEASELLYLLGTGAPESLDFQVLCETGEPPAMNLSGGGGLACQSAPVTWSTLPPVISLAGVTCLLRRRPRR